MRVRYLGASQDQINYGGGADSRIHLVVGEVYAVEHIVEREWHTHYYINGKPYNSVCFEEVEVKLTDIRDYRALLSRVSYKNWELLVGEQNKVPYLQWRFRAPEYADSGSGMQEWYSRKWMLSGLDHNEVIRTAFKAARNAELHECEEAFKFDGVSIYNPHHDVHELVRLARKMVHS